MMELGRKLFVLAIFGAVASQISAETSTESNEYSDDATLTIRELIEKYGYNGESHRIVTEDGYILEMHRITGSSSNSSAIGKPPVLLVHPLLGSSTDWIITGPGKAFGYVLADQGYDVWLGNFRGNRFARENTKYTSVDKEFWQFSWHESGTNDIPAMIDYILEKTNNKQLTYVGHSQGSTSFWVMATERPEYQAKVKAMFALAPIAYMTYTTSPFYQILSKFGHSIETLLDLLGYYEFEPTNKIVTDIAKIVCKNENWTPLACSNVMFLIGGASYDQVNETMLPTILAHAPAGGSVKQILHYLQVIKAQKFQKYDFGIIGNLLKYHSLRPPTYQLSDIKVPVYLYFSESDRFATEMDVDRLYTELGNAVGKFSVPNTNFAHLDFIWGNDARELVYDKVIAQIGMDNKN